MRRVPFKVDNFYEGSVLRPPIFVKGPFSDPIFSWMNPCLYTRYLGKMHRKLYNFAQCINICAKFEANRIISTTTIAWHTQTGMLTPKNFPVQCRALLTFQQLFVFSHKYRNIMYLLLNTCMINHYSVKMLTINK